MRTLRTAKNHQPLSQALEGEGGGFEEGRRSSLVDHLINESPMDTRDPLASYLLSLSRSPSSAPTHIPLSSRSNPNLLHQEHPWTPPSSVTPNIRIPLRLDPSHRLSVGRSPGLPMTPTSMNSFPSSQPEQSLFVHPDRPCEPIQLIHDLFPSHAHIVTLSSYALEMVTPPGHTTLGFIHDVPSTGRSVYVHLPSAALLSQAARPEALSAAFSEVLRPNEPVHRSSSPDGTTIALDIKESLTALLDLACDNLEATSLVLVLDKPNELEALNGLLHSLMYVGGRLVRPGALAGGLDWDTDRWMLVGIDL